MRGPPKYAAAGIVVAAIATLTLLAAFSSSSQVPFNRLYNSNATSADVSLEELNSASKHAFCVFLNQEEGDPKGEEEDHYFVGTRMLIYQLLHDPETKTNTSIEFVVLVANNVPEDKRQRLRKDGAIVTEVEEINIEWIKPRRSRWNHVMDKLHAWELTQYEKVLLLDGDTVVTRRLDPLFYEVEAQPLPNLGNSKWTQGDEGPQPTEYLMAGNSGPFSPDHDYPAPRGNRLNAGFVLFKPDKAMYEHYMAVASIEDRFDSNSPEQNLWNYIHRRKKGNMPWQQINPDWTANAPNYNDYKNGIASFHEKYWHCEKDLELKNVLLRSRWKMEGYFGALDE